MMKLNSNASARTGAHRTIYARPRVTAQRRAQTTASAAAQAAADVAYRIRRATPADSQAVAELYSEVFGSGNFPGFEDNPALQQVEARYASAVGRESSDKLAEALNNKTQAALQCRVYRATRRSALLRAQLCLAQGLPATFPSEGPAELRQLARWRRARSFVCLLAEAVAADGSPRQLLGTATLSMMQAEAVLPPPFPSNAPLRAYISNMAVAPGLRRQGIGKTLVGACGRIARAWGQPAVLLHVAADNTTAQQLYQHCGFASVPGSEGLSGIIKGPWTQQRMVAGPAALAANYRLSRLSSSGSSGQLSAGNSKSTLGGFVSTSASKQQQWQQASRRQQRLGATASASTGQRDAEDELLDTLHDMALYTTQQQWQQEQRQQQQWLQEQRQQHKDGGTGCFADDEEEFSSGCELLQSSHAGSAADGIPLGSSSIGGSSSSGGIGSAESGAAVYAADAFSGSSNSSETGTTGGVSSSSISDWSSSSSSSSSHSSGFFGADSHNSDSSWSSSSSGFGATGGHDHNASSYDTVSYDTGSSDW